MNRTDKLLDRAQTVWADELRQLKGLPDPAYVCYGNEYHWYKRNYQMLRKLLDTRRKLGWASGVFDCLTAISMDDDKARRAQTFMHGEGI